MHLGYLIINDATSFFKQYNTFILKQHHNRYIQIWNQWALFFIVLFWVKENITSVSFLHHESLFDHISLFSDGAFESVLFQLKRVSFVQDHNRLFCSRSKKSGQCSWIMRDCSIPDHERLFCVGPCQTVFFQIGSDDDRLFSEGSCISVLFWIMRDCSVSNYDRLSFARSSESALFWSMTYFSGTDHLNLFNGGRWIIRVS